MYHFGPDTRAFSACYLFLLCGLGLVLLAANIKLHRQALASGLAVNTLGVKASVLSCLFLTPLEAVIVLPAINLLRLKNKFSVEPLLC
ncbi:hypothetical protein [Shewanella salipaludis]|uniref:Uncharacterized protein n=1 Tax=Shewanella salipaludis TaxID=2723052 RepID=A0A972FR83_9GAMM|nr:hypothetical protein [Shewanella salipaludis]NMH64257.1 hypothetical protein [Shewanella salipaludis]